MLKMKSQLFPGRHGGSTLSGRLLLGMVSLDPHGPVLRLRVDVLQLGHRGHLLRLSGPESRVDRELRRVRVWDPGPAPRREGSWNLAMRN